MYVYGYMGVHMYVGVFVCMWVEEQRCYLSVYFRGDENGFKLINRTHLIDTRKQLPRNENTSNCTVMTLAKFPTPSLRFPGVGRSICLPKSREIRGGNYPACLLRHSAYGYTIAVITLLPVVICSHSTAGCLSLIRALVTT